MKRLTVCKILNPTNDPIFLRRRATVAVISKFEAESINVVDTKPLISYANNVENSVNVSQVEKLEAIVKKGIKLDQNDLTDEQYRKLINIIYENIDLFDTSMHDLVGTDVAYLYIDTGSAHPVRKRPYRQPPAALKEMERQVSETEKAGIVQECESTWSSHVC